MKDALSGDIAGRAGVGDLQEHEDGELVPGYVLTQYPEHLERSQQASNAARAKQTLDSNGGLLADLNTNPSHCGRSPVAVDCDKAEPSV